MASKAAAKRLAKEYVNMQREPPPYVWAQPEETDILTWHYIIRGPEDSPFAGGEYHGVLLFPSEYPFKPPGIKMFTPSARFQPDRRICFSMSDFHPGSWNPAWSVSTILTGLLSFMLSDEITTGGLASSDQAKRAYASKSHAWNAASGRFKLVFPEYATEQMKDLPNMGEKERGTPSTKPSAPTPEEQPTTPAPSTPAASSNNGQVKKKHPSQEDANAWGRMFSWDRWKWGLFVVLAVVVSRLTTSPK